MAKAYKYNDTGHHIEYRDGKGVTGTVRYVSINTHYGYEASRRDDIEGIMYVVIYLFNGRLPWQNPSQDFQSKEELSDYIREKKENIALFDSYTGINMQNLTNSHTIDVPIELRRILEYVKALDFEEKPDYTY